MGGLPATTPAPSRGARALRAQGRPSGRGPGPPGPGRPSLGHALDSGRSVDRRLGAPGRRQCRRQRRRQPVGAPRRRGRGGRARGTAAATTPSPSVGRAEAGARQASERRAAELTDHRARVERAQAAVAVERAARHQRVASMSPEEVVAVDRAREALVAAQARQRQMAAHEQAGRHALAERSRGPEMRGRASGSEVARRKRALSCQHASELQPKCCKASTGPRCERQLAGEVRVSGGVQQYPDATRTQPPLSVTARIAAGGGRCRAMIGI